MNNILIAFLFFITSIYYSRADFIDFVSVYLNGQPLEISNKRLDSKILQIGDTLLFHAQTDWDDLFHASLEIRSRERVRPAIVPQIKSQQYGAIFQLIVTEYILQNTCDFLLHFNIESHKQPWMFLTVLKEN
jgi:hypothetical protein